MKGLQGMFFGFAIARLLTLTLFGFLQRLLLSVDQLSILLSNIVYVHDEFVKTLMKERDETRFARWRKVI